LSYGSDRPSSKANPIALIATLRRNNKAIAPINLIY
jgi:hypothetical protein